jgi:Protein of unknown function (DUF4230)
MSPRSVGSRPKRPIGRKVLFWTMNAAGRVIIGKIVWIAIGGTVVSLLAVGGLAATGKLFATQTTVTSDGVLVSLRKIADFHASTATFNVTVDIKQDHRFVPSFLLGRSMTYDGVGTDDAIVNFGALKDGDIRLTDDNTAVSITLPTPVVGPASLDLAKSHVESSDEGIASRIGNIFQSDPGLQQQTQQAAVQEIHTDAEHSQLVARGEDSTRSFLTGFVEKLGLKKVSVSFR